MGQSTDGLLAFGWDLGSVDDADEGHWSWPLLRRYRGEGAEDFDEDDLVYEAHGIDPTLPWKERYERWHELERRGELLFELVHHCSCDYTMIILTLRGANWSASRGYPVNLTSQLSGFDVDGATSRLYAAATKLGLEPPAPPAWLLASHWC